MKKAFGYIYKDTSVHRLTGASKLIFTLLMSVAAMITFDTRVLVIIIFISLVLFKISQIKFSDFKFILAVIILFLIVNNIAIFLFSPEQGVEIYGTRNELFHIAGRYYLTQEQLFYQFNITVKYFAVVPIALVFFLTTEPGEFASSLNTLKVNFKVAFAVSLSLRYIPDIQQSYREISQAQQARGVDISKKAPIRARIAGILAILFPLVFSSLDRIELISNAMELRGFGRLKRRTWYKSRSFTKWDYVLVGLSILSVILSVLMIEVNDGRFYNPFM